MDSPRGSEWEPCFSLHPVDPSISQVCPLFCRHLQRTGPPWFRGLWSPAYTSTHVNLCIQAQRHIPQTDRQKHTHLLQGRRQQEPRALRWGGKAGKDGLHYSGLTAGPQAQTSSKPGAGRRGSAWPCSLPPPLQARVTRSSALFPRLSQLKGANGVDRDQGGVTRPSSTQPGPNVDHPQTGLPHE